MTEKKFYDISLMLLGPGREHLRYRLKVKEELERMGYKNIIIMEESDDDLNDITLDNKFHRIITENDPALIFAFFYNGARMDGVTFELGWLCRNYTALKLHNKLKILEEKDYDWSGTTPYIEGLFSNVNHMTFDETKEYSKASRHINTCVLESIVDNPREDGLVGISKWERLGRFIRLRIHFIYSLRS